MAQSHSPRLTAVWQALLVTGLWSSSVVLIKFGLEDIPGLTFAGLRFTLAFVCLIPFVLRAGYGPLLANLSKRNWIDLLGLGLLLYAGTQGAWFVSLSLLPAVTVNLLWSFSTVVVAGLGIVLLAERPARWQWVGLALALVGALIYFYPVALLANQSLGLLVAVLGVSTNALAALLGRRVNRRGDMPALLITVVSMGSGGLILLAVGSLTQGLPGLGLRSWLIVTVLAVVNTAFAFTLWNQTMRVLSAVESSVINGAMLIWIPILAVIFLGEQITPKEMVGLIVAGAGTLLVQLRRPRLSLRLRGWWRAACSVLRKT